MGTKHLTEADRLRARTLFFDAGLPKARICQITGFSLNQVKLAIREKTPKTRSGRPPRRRPGATAGTTPAPGILGGLPGSGDDALEGTALVGENARGDHGEHGEDTSLRMSHSLIGQPPKEAAVHQAGNRMSPLPTHEQHQHHQHQHHHDNHHGQPHGQGHSQLKWDTTTSYTQQPPYYSSWPPPGPTPLSPSSTVGGVAGGPRGSMAPASPQLPPPTTTSMRMLSATVGSLGIPSPSASSMAGSIQGRADGRDSSFSSSVGSGGRRSDVHDFSTSSTSSSLASSATSYSSTSYSHMASSSSAGGGFSLPSILASATGP
ncbi:hypothetical protein SBRCBS47491_008388 [Sporothrix bragantina]|uniref:Uncharacterized protein n=1 Tax=Sporothrix bragantina TaxID=671064 RepID=A0ABP0CNN0_9PEZI